MKVLFKKIKYVLKNINTIFKIVIGEIFKSIMNEKYSYKNFMFKSLLKIDTKELNNTEIIGSCFYQEKPFTDVFPADIRGVTFTNCNLDNCNMPDGAIISSGNTNKQIKVQNDLEMWIVDKDLKPISPLNEGLFDKYSISKDPLSISATPLTKHNITFIKAMEAKGVIISG